MSGAGRSWADHPFVVLLGVVAAAIGVIVGIKELAASSEDPPSVSAPASTTPSSTVWPSDDTKASPTPEEDAIQAPDEEATTPGSTPRKPSYEALPPDDQEPESPQHTGALTVLVKMGRGGKVGPNSWRAGAEPGANTEVYDETGRLDTGCYVQWTLKHDGKVVQKHTSSRCRPPSITLFNFEDGLEPGSYTLTADVTTDWHQTGTDTFSFDVVPA